eukprot:TRINITY_DN18404_c0_g1_i1.p1 TRINITY_DN18404_c0_g1~~TRINITY_DN18404_c0_g1_i1.p1  ORF type:complete len:150 (+),score=49.18 TRINITY_DN18404_c0_g1_i1:79-528(+)
MGSKKSAAENPNLKSTASLGKSIENEGNPQADPTLEKEKSKASLTLIQSTELQNGKQETRQSKEVSIRGSRIVQPAEGRGSKESLIRGESKTSVQKDIDPARLSQDIRQSQAKSEKEKSVANSKASLHPENPPNERVSAKELPIAKDQE